jgi:hypothetical protein
VTISNSYLIRVRAATETQWTLEDPILADGEPGYVSDLNRWKVGDGTTVWSSLPYAEGPEGPVGPVGPEGPPTPTVDFQGSVADSASLPAGASLGDAYLVTDPDPDEMWVYSSSGWIYAGLAGVQGPVGPEGPQGPESVEIEVSTIEPTNPDVDIWVHPTANVDSWAILDGRYYTQAVIDAERVSKSGDTMSGDLTVTGPTHGTISIDATASGGAYLRFKSDGQNRWALYSQDTGLFIARYDYDTGAWVETSLYIDEVTGEVRSAKTPTDWAALANKNYVDVQSGAPQSFTPVITQNGSVVPNGTIFRSSYSRIGNMVTFELSMYTGDSTGTGHIYISPPVPYITSASGGWTIGQGGCQTSSGNHPVNVYRQPGANSDFYLYKSADANSAVLTDQLTSTSVLRIGGTYLIA